MIVEFSFNDFICCLDDCIGDFLVKSELHINDGSAFFQYAKRLDDWTGHDVEVSTDVKVFERPLGLGTP